MGSPLSPPPSPKSLRAQPIQHPPQTPYLAPPLVPATEPTKKGLGDTNLGSNVSGSPTMPGGACPGFYINREPFLDVIRMHRASVNNINKTNVPSALFEGPKACWDEALVHGAKHGYRNFQVT